VLELVDGPGDGLDMLPRFLPEKAELMLGWESLNSSLKDPARRDDVFQRELDEMSPQKGEWPDHVLRALARMLQRLEEGHGGSPVPFHVAEEVLPRLHPAHVGDVPPINSGAEEGSWCVRPRDLFFMVVDHVEPRPRRGY
jgi:hypothetical protein